MNKAKTFLKKKNHLLRKDFKNTHTYEVYVFRSLGKGAPDKAMCSLFALIIWRS